MPEEDGRLSSFSCSPHSGFSLPRALAGCFMGGASGGTTAAGGVHRTGAGPAEPNRRGHTSVTAPATPPSTWGRELWCFAITWDSVLEWWLYQASESWIFTVMEHYLSLQVLKATERGRVTKEHNNWGRRHLSQGQSLALDCHTSVSPRPLGRNPTDLLESRGELCHSFSKPFDSFSAR